MDYTHYRFIEKPIEWLDEPAPVDCDWSYKDVVYDEDGKRTDGTLKTIGEFLLHYVTSVDGTTILARLAAKEAPNYRTRSVGADDLSEWYSFLQITEADTMDVNEYWALLETEEYKQEEV